MEGLIILENGESIEEYERNYKRIKKEKKKKKKSKKQKKKREISSEESSISSNSSISDREQNEIYNKSNELRNQAGLSWMTTPREEIILDNFNSNLKEQCVATTTTTASITSKKEEQSNVGNLKDPLNLSNPFFPKTLIITLAENSFMMIPPNKLDSFCIHHCYIVPRSVSGFFRDLDNKYTNEIERFKRSILEMNALSGLFTVFFETCFDSKKITKIECISVLPEHGELLPIYFKKELLETDEEWSDHPKILDLSNKSLKQGLPPRSPYFFVEIFDNNVNSLIRYAHLIENVKKFPPLFGLDIINGSKKDQGRNVVSERDRLMIFLKAFEKYDWTAELDA